RCFLRALMVSPLRSKFTVVAINEPADLESMAYLTRFDSTHGCFPGVVEVGDGCLRIDGADIPVFHVSTPGGVDWASLGVDLLIEASGQYSCRHELEAFLAAGCRRVLLSHPGLSAADVDQTIVFGMNHHLLDGDERIVSAASCTTNAIVPVLAMLDEAYGLDHALLTTLHSVMNDQPLIDGYHHSDLHRTRSAMQSMIPVSTGLARGVVRLLPELAGKLGERCQLVVIGVTPEQCKALPASILGIQKTANVRELAAWYTVADCLANPTLEDNMPMVNLESFACGTPVVAFDTGGCAEAIPDTCGTVTPKGDVDAMADAIHNIARKKAAFSQACFSQAECFDAEASAKAYWDLYQEVLR
ncbi:MAG TPA: glyceraldehyde 3-phosphate dehydrogenase NAD-binding domain-containing protein, partial [Candidatus Limiplasma sp.]|nr:glyceraldehyde 3-phosphate dehydrogenase NAD-binding domain-containing protein [Candidatus Limiplasma sp.]